VSVSWSAAVLAAVSEHGQGDINGFVAYEALVSDLDPDGVEKHEGVAKLERPVLPLSDGLLGTVRNSVRWTGFIS